MLPTFLIVNYASIPTVTHTAKIPFSRFYNSLPLQLNRYLSFFEKRYLDKVILKSRPGTGTGPRHLFTIYLFPLFFRHILVPVEIIWFLQLAEAAMLDTVCSTVNLLPAPVGATTRVHIRLKDQLEFGDCISFKEAGGSSSQPSCKSSLDKAWAAGPEAYIRSRIPITSVIPIVLVFLKLLGLPRESRLGRFVLGVLGIPFVDFKGSFIL